MITKDWQSEFCGMNRVDEKRKFRYNNLVKENKQTGKEKPW